MARTGRPRRNVTTCHPDQPHHAKGLCKECYYKAKYDSAKYKAYVESNRERILANNRERKRKYDRDNPERAYAVQIKYKYGVALEEYKARLNAQGGKCAICGSTSPGGSSKTRFCVDHCHTTGTVRGLLCSHCNLAISYMKDDTSILDSAISYLQVARRQYDTPGRERGVTIL